MRTVTVILVGATLLLSACVGGLSQGGATAEQGAPGATTAASAEEDIGLEGRLASQTALPFPSGVKVIREARLELRVEEGSFQERWEALRLRAADLGGYLSDARVGGEDHDGRRYAAGTATLRIPVDRFDEALDILEDLGERLSLEVSGRDVTEEFVDLEARLRHWKAMEAFHLGLLEQAETVEDALRIQDRLSDIQLTIEQIEGRLRHLESRTTFATITVRMSEAPLTGSAGPALPDELAEALAQARRVLVTVFGLLIVAAAAAFPLALVGGTGLALWKLGRRIAAGA